MTSHRVFDVATVEGRRKLVARELGARAVRLNQFDSQPGQAGFEHHERESGQEEVYVAPRPDPGAAGRHDAGAGSRGQWQVSSGGGSVPRWARGGRSIFYRRADNTTFAEVEVDGAGASFRVGKTRELALRAYQNWGSLSYDVSPDGRRLVVASPGGDSTSTMALVSDWTAIVK